MSGFGVYPDVSRFDRAIRRRLADSLSHIADRAGPALSIDTASFGALLERIRARRQHPGVFAAYYDLSFALLGSSGEDAQQCLDDLLEHRASADQFEIVPYDTAMPGRDFERFSRLLFAEYDGPNPMCSPSAAEVAEMRGLIEEALETVRTVDPQVAGEIDELWKHIYLAAHTGQAGAFEFAGVTSFMIWGATFMNVGAFTSPWPLVQFMVHESTHSLLFALGVDEPLVKNPVEQGFKSPFRADPRPMDGIFHATMVCARVLEFDRTALGCGAVRAEDRPRVEAGLKVLKRSYNEGVEVLRRDGILSDLASDLLDKSSRSMAIEA